ncbi:MAG: TRAP transporter substrate-binding protein DctP, partial [Alphaproteobacteria bacterium]|jgi:TRAP-type C4-dicarboxylate transport system substrate-binding protein|nr:TRAP transporter substrate-binding protein DctP [Alphaproteobacteria bacterium]
MKKKITSMDQLKGLKIRAVGPVMVASIKALGAAPEPLPFTKITEAISRGRINGTTAHPIALHDFGIARVTKSHYFGRLGTVPLAVLMNRKVYHGLPAKVRAAIDKNSGESLSIAFGEMSETRNKELHGIWKKDGSRTVTDQSAAEAKAWDAALAPVITEWVKANARNAKLIAALKGTLKNIRAGN